ncbi:unnamed protein product [Mytilus edulis]|uniref:MULE transposase domain-containing protein n=1 Tax=Mytilus edulis TaxID=6550 RepID=A0A8S3RA94_MYTED|nr:unnamed protein product [Mytilus edulis]
MAYVTRGRRGGHILIYNGFKYQKNKTRLDKVHWRCWRPACRAPLRTNLINFDEEEPNIDVLHVGQHDHPEDQDLILSSNIRRQMTAAVADNPSLTVREAYDDIAHQIPPAERDNIPTYDSVRSSLDRTRRRYMPEIPASINDVDIRGRWRVTLDGNRFLSKLDNGWGIAVFCTTQALRCLGQCNDIYIDATFKSTPAPYKQFLTIHGFYRDRVIPLVFALMTDRNVANYRQILGHLKRRYSRLTNNQLTPTNIISDFETAIMTAAHTDFPNSRIMGCFFHFCKSVWRRVQKEGLRRSYNRSARLKRCIRKLMAIAYLPVAVVRQNFHLFVQDVETRNLCRRYHGLRDLLLYFERNYLNGQFQPATWNVFNRDMDNRTNNHVEVKKEERRSVLGIQASNRGDNPPTRRLKYRRLQARIDRLQATYRAGNRNIDQYWNAMIYTVAQFQ